MTVQSDYLCHDAIGLAQLVAQREASARELLDAAIGRAQALNPALNAIVLNNYAAARERATSGALDGPLAGVPYLVKDLGSAVGGLPLSLGSRHYRHYVPAEDSPLIARTKAAGLNIFGKTNTSELGQMPYTESALFGVCRNPWNLDHTPGGSSGGAAAAVAAGIVPLAHASDGGGSIRIPASCCGLFGFKPSRDPALAPWPVPGEIVVEHAVSRSVRDSALLLDITTGRIAPGGLEGAGAPGTYLGALDAPPPALKIGYVTDPMLAPALSADVRDALERAASLAASLGHNVEPATLNLDFEQIGEVFLTIWAAIADELVLGAERITGRKPARAEFEPATWAMAQVGRHLARERLPHMLELQRQITARVAGFVSRYDAILCATLAAPPIKIGEMQPTPFETRQMELLGVLPMKPLLKRMLAEVSRQAFAWAGCTELFNLTGQPAMSVPLHWTARGLPVGVQFVARHGDDARLFALARQLELAQPWFDKRPPLVRAQA
ncbi:amidase family protein [Burkholderia thailandensis]|uniref:6-aminohexanoate-cyclic-dimer hydrolase n=1 Tax=Burkholderia thailandensis (strain ATCC 700388 / DSM 13276 / CCUG 48851 / CIP 106301 / E264) TaxID=271848 RepID=Q2STU4_BURTA|nr:amidase family protein [Burkholderia thailandensis]ABC37289.1 6-aminohexanoate-cyclic-dimer hydrolase [Burkholderia thailandensis E264]AOJ46726.1 6-aminohexanoate hydrolase [Burkholderia thailandensis]KVG15681.1 6-aminohexanoate hydrolase [Burkholderia thailandensis]MCS6472856.1 amidase family protein [Burkholderia thailandensis]MCS6502237.1 amidase family protein [Burkholderia thailandensis]